jgi:transposase
MLADEVDYVIGVDPHRDTHTFAVVEAGSGGLVFDGQVAASVSGYLEALRSAGTHVLGRRAWAIEGTGSYGAGLSRFLAERGELVVEVGRLRRQRRSQAKTDALDALRTARSVLGETRLAEPRVGGERDGLRALMVARESALVAKKACLCQLRALIVTCPEPLRTELAPLTRARLLSRCVSLRPDRHKREDWRATLLALRSLAARAQALTLEERALEREIRTLVTQLAPQLLTEPGVGPISAAQLVISWSHPGRVRSEAAFARLAGAAPIPASSGQTIRYRLDRGGDRKLNRALQTIILTRRRQHPATIAYIERRRAEGKTRRESVRCLKRYLARHLYRLLEAEPKPA